MDHIDWTVDPPEAGERLDHFVAARGSLSHAAARRVIEEERVRVNGRRGRKGQRLQAGDRVRVDGPLPDAAALSPAPEPEAPLEVLYTDGDLVVVNKPPGIASHPLRAGEHGTLASALVARHPECRGVGANPREAGLCHRLDIETSGVLVAARHAAAWEAMRRAFQGGAVSKEYLALVAGRLEAPETVDAPLGHDERDRRRMAVTSPWSDEGTARDARTQVVPLGHAGDRTLVRALTSTGRMHQVRVHLAHLGHPLVGDALYGGPPPAEGAPGHFLHAERLVAPHPRGTTLDVHAPLPAARAAALHALGLWPLLRPA